jgi:tRNA A-37 threonylcarbamoyl transferase component Bud32
MPIQMDEVRMSSKPIEAGRMSRWSADDIGALIGRLKKNGAAHSDSNSSPCSIGTAERT